MKAEFKTPIEREVVITMIETEARLLKNLFCNTTIEYNESTMDCKNMDNESVHAHYLLYEALNELEV